MLHPAMVTGNHNDDSVVLEFGCPGARVLLTGDAEHSAEKDMIATKMLSDIDVLKVSHHGSKTGTSQAFIDVVKPEHAIISAGKVNSYGHPDEGVVERLKKAGAKVHATDTASSDDTIMFKADCKAPYAFETPLQY